MQAKEIMTTDVVIVPASETVARVVNLFVQKSVTCAVIVDDNSNIQGIVTDGDIMAAIRQRRPVYVDLFNSVFILQDNFDLASKLSALAKTPIKDIATKRVFSVTEDATVTEIAGLMADKKIKQVPITRDGCLVGLVRRQDIIYAVAQTPHIEEGRL
jgi:predicted transcriptional regulator